MTPFGARLRVLRAGRGMTMAELAGLLQISPAYLSALEHGHRGVPSSGLVHQICDAFGLIWDEADELVRLARLSHPRVTVDTAGLSPEQTALANRLAQVIHRLSPATVAAFHELLDRAPLSLRRFGGHSEARFEAEAFGGEAGGRAAGPSPRCYTEEYKRQVADLVVSTGRTASSVAAEAGVHHTLLSRWVRQYGQSAGLAATVPVAVSPPSTAAFLKPVPVPHADQAAEIARSGQCPGRRR